MKLGDQGRECLRSQSYHNPPKDQKFEELSKALEWILHHCCHLEQPVFRKKREAKFEKQITLLQLKRYGNTSISSKHY